MTFVSVSTHSNRIWDIGGEKIKVLETLKSENMVNCTFSIRKKNGKGFNIIHLLSQCLKATARFKFLNDFDICHHCFLKFQQDHVEVPKVIDWSGAV